MKKFLLPFILLASTLGFGQATRVDGQVTGPNGQPVHFPTIRVCTNTSNLGSGTTLCGTTSGGLKTLYTNYLATTACTGSNGCSNPFLGDYNGNYHFYGPPGKAILEVITNGVVAYDIPDFVVTCDPDLNCGTGGGSGGVIPVGNQGQFLEYTGAGASATVGPGTLLDSGGILSYSGGGVFSWGGPGIGTSALNFHGSTSGLLVVTAQNASGNWTMTLPNGPGLSGQVLSTDGAGNTTWSTPSASAVGAGAVNQVAVYNGLNSVAGDALFTESGNTLTYLGTTVNLGNASAAVLTTFDGTTLTTGSGVKDTLTSGTSTNAGLTSGRNFIIQAHAGTATGFGGDLVLEAVGSTFAGNQSLSPGGVYIQGGENSGSSGGAIYLIPGNGNVNPTYVAVGCNGSLTFPCGSAGNGFSSSVITGNIGFAGKTNGGVFLKAADNVGAVITLQLPTTVGTNGQVLSTDGSGVMSWISPAGGGGTIGGSGTNTFLPKFTAGTVLGNSALSDNGTTVFDSENLSVATTVAATNVSNVNSPITFFQGNYWNGSASAADNWNFQDVLGVGTNPTATLTLLHGGSSGAAAVSALFPFTISGLTFTGGTLDASLVTSAIPWITGAGVPAGGSCVKNGQVYFRTDGTPGQQLYFCNGAGTWTLQLNSGSGGANVALSNLAGVAFNAALTPGNGALGTSAADLGSASNPIDALWLGTVATNNTKLVGSATVARTATFPDNTGTVAETNLAQSWSGVQTFTSNIIFNRLVSSSANVATTGSIPLGPTDAIRYGCPGCNATLSSTGTTDMNLIRGGNSTAPILVGDYLGMNVDGPIGTFVAGGSLTIQPTAAVAAGTGGDLTLAGGNTSTTGNNGNVHLKAGTGGSGNVGFVDIGTSGFGPTISNDTVTGTFVSNLVSTTSTGNAIQTPAGATSGVVGVAGAGAGTTGSVTVVQLGRATCVFDGSAVPGHYVGISANGNGQCADVGLAPVGTAQTIGTVLSLVSGTTYSVLVNLGSAPGSATANNVITNPSSSQTIQALAPTAVGFAVKQPASGSVDIFQVLLANGSKVFSINSTGQAVFGTGTSSVTSAAFLSASSNIAATGNLRMSSSDPGVCFKNNGNTTDICMAKNNSDTITFSTATESFTSQGAATGVTLVYVTPSGSSRTYTFPDAGANDSVAYLAASQTFTQKTIGDLLLFTEVGTPANPAAGSQEIYAGTDHLFHCLTNTGANCFPAGGGGASALSAITAATGTNTINSANFPQVWQWKLTTNSTKAFSFAESAASTATGSDLVNISTLAASTLNPLTITALGTANGLRVSNIGDLTFLGTGMVDLGTTAQVGTECANEGVTGTTNGLVAKMNASNQCIKATTSDVGGVEGIVVKGGGTSGNAVIATSGVVPCTFSNATTVGDWVGVSTATPGNCLDLGVNPTAGTQVLGRVLTSGLAATSQSVQVYGRGMLGIQGTTNQVNTAFAGGILTLSLPQNLNTAATVQFGAVKTTQITTVAVGSGITLQNADTNNASSVTGLVTVRGGDQTGTANGSAGNTLVRGGSSASTGTGAAGNLDLRAGQSTAAANKNGAIQFEPAYIKGATYTVGNIQCFSADNTVADCATSSTNFVGVALLSNGNAAVVDNAGSQILVNYDATVSPSAGWFACSSASVAGKVTAQSAACAAGRTVGIIEAAGTNVTSGNITYAHF